MYVYRIVARGNNEKKKSDIWKVTNIEADTPLDGKHCVLDLLSR